ncbi:hypothetical protein GCM10008018_13290 [Paenibacillus marchantiophytorum]|uniref:DUF2975 domain-containing protein n=1 Tax=Paenibacillus marchantiophytorum TaxID=1619310 RepID=A0ABQ2BR92_9BACL|nr:DUF2975 domain-containing protein [Paenibacillus marchantiophytorum]GGI45664.1 hypothetical protein GCM10008018_13290 [Paenibacillus marchantiophytorum]
MRQKELSAWLKLIIIICGLFGLLFCLYIGPETGRGILLDSGNRQELYHPFVAFIWITGIPFFTSLVLGWRICSCIGSDQAFTFTNADRLKIVSILSMIEGILYVGALLYLLIVGSYHMNIVVILLLILFFSVVISVFTSMLSHLVRNASEISQDNDLTI